MTSASEHGTFRLTYTPPEATGNEEYPLITVEMSTNGDANVDQMLRLYEAFLAASGFILKGDLAVSEPEPEHNLWSMTAQGSQSTDFVPINQLGNDVIYWGGK